MNYTFILILIILANNCRAQDDLYIEDYLSQEDIVTLNSLHDSIIDIICSMTLTSDFEDGYIEYFNNPLYYKNNIDFTKKIYNAFFDLQTSSIFNKIWLFQYGYDKHSNQFIILPGLNYSEGKFWDFYKVYFEKSKIDVFYLLKKRLDAYHNFDPTIENVIAFNLEKFNNFPAYYLLDIFICTDVINTSITIE